MAEPIGINNLLLRGCSLKNTEWVLGVVVFTGLQTKIMLNAGETPSKRARMSRDLNWNVMYNFIIPLLHVSGGRYCAGNRVDKRHKHGTNISSLVPSAELPPVDGYRHLFFCHHLVPELGTDFSVYLSGDHSVFSSFLHILGHLYVLRKTGLSLHSQILEHIR